MMQPLGQEGIGRAEVLRNVPFGDPLKPQNLGLLVLAQNLCNFQHCAPALHRERGERTRCRRGSD
jgi:hypothetical protein